jgi:hypothetical protein
MTADSIVVDGHGRAGACIGDSGGPLLVRDADGRLAVGGVLSRGQASCTGKDSYLRGEVIRDWVNGETGAPPSSGEPCDRLDSTGLCRTGVAVWCDAGFVVGQACSAGTICGWSNAAGGYRCVEPASDPCRGTTDLGACGARAVLRCDQGQLTSRACDCRSPCGWNPTSARFEC